MFEWEEEKNRKNIEKHGMSLAAGCSLLLTNNRIENRSDRDDERRWITTGESVGVVLTAVYTIRHGNYRLISVRRANVYEERKYRETYPR